MSAPLKAEIPVQHKVWVEDAHKDAHGNTTGDYAEPVTRYAQAYYPLGWETGAPDVISADYEARLEFNIEMLVPDASVYHKRDLVEINGLAYEVQSIPYDWSQGLPSFARGYAEMLGGTVHCRRVT